MSRQQMQEQTNHNKQAKNAIQTGHAAAANKIKQTGYTNPASRTSMELLAPAGSFATCKAVIAAGADAVYLGGSRFGARAYAENFSQEDLMQAIDYVHLHGRKVYLTVNTLLKQFEMDEFYSYLLPYYEQGIDAAIVQDFGVLDKIRTCFPNLAVHASTQMSVTSAYGAAYLKKLGVSRIVTARELSIEEINTIYEQTGIELETFVHGALCYCYSGQCLLSSLLGGRSGNRGRCAQPCRLPYTVYAADQKTILQAEGCQLSMKDLCALPLLLQLAKAGVHSLKIEGRMKSPEYAAGVTAIYRKYLDRYENEGCFSVAQKDLDHLADTGSRSGFTSGYYEQRNGRDMLAIERSGYTKNKETYLQDIQERYVKTEKKIPVCADILLKANQPAKLTVSAAGFCATVQYGMAEPAKNSPISEEMVRVQLSKTGQTPFIMEMVAVTMDEPVFLPKQMLNELRRQALAQLFLQMTNKYRRQEASMNHQEETMYVQEAAYHQEETMYVQETGDHQEVLHAQQAVKCSRKHATDVVSQRAVSVAIEQPSQLAAVLPYDFVSRIYLDSSMYPHKQFCVLLKEHTAKIKALGKQAYLIMPAIFRNQTAQFYQTQWQTLKQTGIDGFLCKSYDALGFLEAQKVPKECCVLDHMVYTYSNTAKTAFEKDGWKYDTIPVELNKKELLARCNQDSELMIYGRIPLMVSAQCLQKTIGHCDHSQAVCYIKDRYQIMFPVRANCRECYQTIYNSQPLSLLGLQKELERLQPAAYRLHFTIEPSAMVTRILDSLEKLWKEQEPPDWKKVLGTYTNGHYKRGVE